LVGGGDNIKNKNIKKILVVGIIILFIGVGIQPAFANDISITTTSNIKEDCGCQPISNLHLVRLERLLNRVEIYTNILSLLFKHNSEVKEKCELLSNKIKENSILFSEQ
jgi:hypothetical protein